MTELWVKYKSFSVVKVSTANCYDVCDFIKAVKKELHNKLGSIDSDQISLSLTDGGAPLRPGLLLTDLSSQAGYVTNDDEHPLFITVNDSSGVTAITVLDPPASGTVG